MAKIKPFRGIRPNPEFASRVAALPYDVVNSEEARELVKGNPYSFLHVDKAEIDLENDISPYDKRVYEKARENLDHMIESGVLLQDTNPIFYIYRLVMEGRAQTGLVACSAIDEYLEGKIKKHELTRADKEQDRINHVDICNANTGPIFLAYEGRQEINGIILEWTKEKEPIYDFVAEDGIEHTVWLVDAPETVEKLEQEFQKINCLYIADGHHRNASAVKVGQKRRQAHPDYTGEEEFNFTLSVLFPQEELHIMDYNRVVKDFNGYGEEEFLKKCEEKFRISFFSDQTDVCKPRKIHEFGMYFNGKWYRLEAKEEIISDDPVLKLDVSILQKELLEPVLGIGDPRTDKRIDFVGGIRGLKELEKQVDSGEMAVAFSLFPTSMKELMDIADAGKIMPPKSTWFEPKLRSGLFIHGLD